MVQGLLDDVAVLNAAAAGDPAAIERLLDHAGPVLYGFVLARVGGDSLVAEDLVQETLLEGIRGAAGFRGEAALTTWLCTIARRRVSRHYERERRQDLARANLRAVRDEPAAGADAEVVDRDVVLRALGQLRAIHRQVLVMKYLDGLPVQAIAVEVGRTPVQVQSLLQRARSALRDAIGEPS